MTSPKFAKNTRFGRVYWTPKDGELGPSITNVNRMLAAAGLVNWQLDQVAYVAYRDTDWRKYPEEVAVKMLRAAAEAVAQVAADRGSRIHEAIALELPPTEETLPYLVARAAVLPELGTFYASERTLVSTKHGYAGTADLLTRRNDHPSELAVVDWKSVKVDSDAGWREHQLQLAALARCDSWLDDDGELHDLVDDITELIVVGLRPDETSDVKRLDNPDKITHLHEAFLGLLTVWELNRKYPHLDIWEGK